MDVQIRERPESVRTLAREREADNGPGVVLGDERDLGGDDLPDLRELLLLVGGAFVSGRRDLVVELTPQIRDRVEVLWKCSTNRHPTILAPMSKNWADRFWNGAKRSPMERTSPIDGERPSE